MDKHQTWDGDGPLRAVDFARPYFPLTRRGIEPCVPTTDTQAVGSEDTRKRVAEAVRRHLAMPER